MTIPHGLLMKPGQGTSLSIVGDILTFKAAGEDTAGQYTLAEVRVDPDIGPPPHIHRRFTYPVNESQSELRPFVEADLRRPSDVSPRLNFYDEVISIAHIDMRLRS